MARKPKGLRAIFIPAQLNCSLFPGPWSLVPGPCSLFPVPCSLIPVPCLIYSVHFLITSEALIPPNPNEFDSATSKVSGCATLGT